MAGKVKDYRGNCKRNRDGVFDKTLIKQWVLESGCWFSAISKGAGVKGVKKRIRSILSGIEAAAGDIVLLASDVSALNDLEAMAISVLQACDELRRKVDIMDKSALPHGLRCDDCVERLEVVLDRDDVSAVEQRFFQWLPDQSQGDLAMFLQIWLSKIERCCVKLSHEIRDLLVMLEVEYSICA